MIGKDELKREGLPPPPIGRSIGHGLIENYSFSVLAKTTEFKQ